MPGACFKVDVRGMAELTYQFQLWQSTQQCFSDGGALPDQYQGFDITQPVRQHINLLTVVIPNCDLLTSELKKAIQGSNSILVIVKYCNIHCGAFSKLLEQPNPQPF
jgi:hypothetical protein